MDDGVETVTTKGERATTSLNDDALALKLGHEQRIPRNVGGDEATASRPSDVRAGPASACPDIQQRSPGFEVQVLAKRLSLRDRRVAVQADALAESGFLDATPGSCPSRGILQLEELEVVFHSVPPLPVKANTGAYGPLEQPTKEIFGGRRFNGVWTHWAHRQIESVLSLVATEAVETRRRADVDPVADESWRGVDRLVQFVDRQHLPVDTRAHHCDFALDAGNHDLAVCGHR